jgi:hypothetical protein
MYEPCKILPSTSPSQHSLGQQMSRAAHLALGRSLLVCDSVSGVSWTHGLVLLPHAFELLRFSLHGSWWRSKSSAIYNSPFLPGMKLKLSKEST